MLLINRNSLWKYAITACDNNTEFKVWCCATWQCTQTIRFESKDSDKQLFLKAEIDPTSNYLVLTEATNRGLYVLQIVQNNDEAAITDTDGKSSHNDEQSLESLNGQLKPSAFIKSITEFPLSSPILSFGIVDAIVRKTKCELTDHYLLEELDDYDNDNLSRYCVVIHLFLVQPKSVQECQILYQPSLSINCEVASSVSALSEDNTDEISNEFKKLMNSSASKDESVMSTSTSSTSKSSLSGLPTKTILDSSILSNSSSSSNSAQKPAATAVKSESSLSQQSITKPSSTLNLLTPDSFHSSGKITPEGVSNEVSNMLRMLAGEKPTDGSNLLHLVNKGSEESEDKVKLLQQVSEESNGAASNDNDSSIVPPMPPSSMLTTGVSGGSSPSREVQEILSLKDSDCMNDFYNDSIDIQDDTDGSANNADAADGNDEEKNSNRDDDETYALNNGIHNKYI